MPVPDDASGLVFIRRQDVLVHLAAHAQLQYTGYRVKILHPGALELGNMTITWNPAVGSPVVHAIRIYRQGQTIDVLQTSSFEILRREDQLEASRLDGNLTAVLHIADLRVGDELEVAMTVPTGDPTLGGQNAGVLKLGATPAPGRYRLGLSWEAGSKPDLKIAPDLVSMAKVSESGMTLQMDNPPTLNPPSGAPMRYQWQRMIEYSNYADWPAISRKFAVLFGAAAQLPAGSPLRAEAARIAAAHADPMGRAAAALQLVQQDVRYVYVGLAGGNLTPASAEETWQRRYGDCKAKSVLLLALLGALGVQAEPVLVNSSGADPGLDGHLPNPGDFDHVVVRARIDGADTWLDGTLPPVVGPGTEPAFPLRWVLPLSAAGAPIEHRPWKMAARPDTVTTFDIDASAGFDQPAKVTNTNITRGIKGIQEDVQLSGLTPDQMLNAFRQQLVGKGWQSIDAVAWRYDQKAGASVLRITGTWPLDWQDDGAGARSLPLPGGGFPPPERHTRPADQDGSLPYVTDDGYTCRVATLHWPLATRPADWSTNTSYDTSLFGQRYYRTLEARSGSVRMIRVYRAESAEVDAATARRDNGRIAAFDNSMAWANFRPTSRRPGVPSLTVVPTIDAMDWTADRTPCLPPD